jgi:hypothetical protein
MVEIYYCQKNSIPLGFTMPKSKKAEPELKTNSLVPKKQDEKQPEEP